MNSNDRIKSFLDKYVLHKQEKMTIVRLNFQVTKSQKLTFINKKKRRWSNTPKIISRKLLFDFINYSPFSKKILKQIEIPTPLIEVTNVHAFTLQVDP